MRGTFIFLILVLLSLNLRADNNLKLSEYQLTVLVELDKSIEEGTLIIDVTSESRPVKFKRGKAILFTVFTGLFGGHRVYFGTHHRTPIIYSVTLGGLGILPFVDLVNIIFTKDLSKFDNKTQIIMWGN